MSINEFNRKLHFALGRPTPELPVSLINIYVTQYKWFSRLKGSQEFTELEIAPSPRQDGHGRPVNTESTDEVLSCDRSYSSGKAVKNIIDLNRK